MAKLSRLHQVDKDYYLVISSSLLPNSFLKIPEKSKRKRKKESEGNGKKKRKKHNLYKGLERNYVKRFWTMFISKFIPCKVNGMSPNLGC